MPPFTHKTCMIKYARIPPDGSLFRRSRHSGLHYSITEVIHIVKIENTWILTFKKASECMHYGGCVRGFEIKSWIFIINSKGIAYTIQNLSNSPGETITDKAVLYHWECICVLMLWTQWIGSFFLFISY